MITEDGLRVFIHVGLGTVEMNGKGFARFVEMGDTVKAASRSSASIARPSRPPATRTS